MTHPTLVLDYDGTVTDRDLLDEISRVFGDPAVYDEVERQLHAGAITLRDVITREFEPVTATLDEVVAWLLEHARVRRGFAELVRLAERADWRVLVVSSGFHELIEPVLAREGVEVEVLANRVEARPDGWVVHWRDGTICDECGQPCKRRSLPSGPVVYVGDGYSDRCAALSAERVFATGALAGYLEARHVPFERFDDFRDVARALPAAA
jgi:2,3-diketo-5-methylthio-1-phosphopentane phosphatase